MSGNRELQYYKLTPIFKPEPGSISNAATTTCIATGKTLSGQGGGGMAIDKEIIHQLALKRNSGRPTTIVDAAAFDEMVQALKDARDEAVRTFKALGFSELAHRSATFESVSRALRLAGVETEEGQDERLHAD